VAIRRYDLDHVLLERARSLAVTVLEGAPVRRIDKNSHGWTVEIDRCGEGTALRAKILLGADGRNSAVAQRLGLVRSGEQRPVSTSVGFQIHLTRVPDVHGSVEIHQFAGGYAGLLRLDQVTVNLCFTVKKSLMGKPISYESLRQGFLDRNPFLQRLLASAEPVSELRSVWPVYFKARQSFGEGFILVGDAARGTEPVTGEGIFLALRSGQLGAQAIDAALRRRACLVQYEQACRAEFGARLRVNSLIGAVARSAHLLPPLIRIAGRRGELLQTLVNSVCVGPSFGRVL
jgi:flavin-dependent dehydrogenase